MGLPNVALQCNTNKSYGRGILRGVQRWARLHRTWNLYIGQNANANLWADLENWKGDAIIGQFRSVAQATAYKSRGINLVSVSNRLKYDGVPSVYTDDYAVGRIAAEHLLERGFKHFAYVGFDGYFYSDQRRAGFESRLAADGLRCNICESLPLAETYEAIKTELDAFLHNLPKPVAILGANDTRGQQVTLAAQALGLHVPTEVAVMGVDNDDLQVSLASVPLTSIELAVETIGYNAASMVAKMLAGEWVSTDPMLVPPIGVILRESTDVLASRDEEVAKAVTFIANNAHLDLQVSDVLQQSTLSRRVLEVRFKNATKRTLQEEIWRAHIERAKALLIETDLPMPEIAQKSGFPNSSRLSSVFRRETSMTPTKYRRLYRQH